MTSQVKKSDPDAVREQVRKGYASIAKAGTGCCGSTAKKGARTKASAWKAASCCGTADADGLAVALGYSASELAALPEGANLGLSCGNPAAVASLKAGETVLDLGSGAGFDVFVVGRKVGAKGRAIGVDMTPDMLAKARRNVAIYREKSGFENVEFRLGEIEHLPVADNSVDVVISNCVINLSPDKPQVWREIARVLKPGGRVAVSDLALTKPIPPKVAATVEALVGCIAGAVLVEETGRMAKEAGLTRIVLDQKHDYVDQMTDWNDPLYRKIVDGLPAGTKISAFVTSLYVSARKPAIARPVAKKGTVR